MKLPKFSNKTKWIVVFVVSFLVIAYPFVLSVLLGPNPNEKWTFNLPFNVFINSWFVFFSVLGVAIGIYQVQKKAALSKKQTDTQHDLKDDTQQRQLEVQYELMRDQQRQLDIQNKNANRVRYANCMAMLNMDNEIVRLQALNDLYLLANENPKEYIVPVCKTFCDIISSKSDKYSQKEIQRIFKYLFVEEPRIFDQLRKDINNSRFADLMITDAHINNTNFNNTIIDNCKIHHSEITNSNFIGSTFKNCVFRTTHFNNIIFRKAIFSDQTIFSRLNIDGSVFTSAKFNDVGFDSVGLCDSDFSEAEIEQTTFIRTNFTRCILDFKRIRQVKLNFIDSRYLDAFKKMLPNKYLKVANIEGDTIIHISKTD